MTDCKVGRSQHSPSNLAVRMRLALQTLHGTQFLMQLFVKGLCQWVGNLIGCVATFELDLSILVALTDKVILHVDMLGPLVDCSIKRKILGTIVVYTYADSVGLRLVAQICNEP